jgi:hypothetical protein
MTIERVLRIGRLDLPRVPLDVCCDEMSAQLSKTCERHSDPADCDNVIYWSPTLDEYGLIVHNGGAATYWVIEHCPWCGMKLPESKRDRWFRELETLGFEDPLGEDIPPLFESDEWYRDIDGKSELGWARSSRANVDLDS